MKVDQAMFSEVVAGALAGGKAVRLRVQGASMRPWLREGDPVRIQPAAGRPVRRGDVVLFRRAPDRPILHRVVRVRRDENAVVYHCRGDAEHGAPECIPAAEVLGVMESTPLRRAAWRVLFLPRRLWSRCMAGRGGVAAGTEAAEGFDRLRRLCAAVLRGDSGAAGAPALEAAGLLSLAERHRVVPLLAAGLGSSAPPDIRRRALALAQQGIRLDQELAAVAACLSAAGVRFLLLKGPALARQAYPAPELRSCDDLDLWLEPDNLDVALAALESAGYRRTPPLAPRVAAGARRAGLDVALVHPLQGRLVELASGHRRLAPTRRAAREVLAEAVALDVAGATIRAPAPVHALLLACLHGAHHRWDRLAWVADVAGLWQRLTAAERAAAGRTALRWRVGTQLGIGLELARMHFGSETGGFTDRPQKLVARAARWAGRVRLEEIGPETLRVARRAAWAYECAVQDAAWRRWRLRAAGLFTPTLVDLQAHPLPPFLFPLYGVLRAFRLFRRFRR